MASLHVVMGEGGELAGWRRTRKTPLPAPFGVYAQDLANEVKIGDIEVADFAPSGIEPWTLERPIAMDDISKLVCTADPVHEIMSKALEYIEKCSRHTLIYTDGSKCPATDRVV